MALPVLTQQRSLDPYDSNRWSSVINRFTRVITGGRDVILHSSTSFRLSISDDPVNSEAPYSTIDVSAGLCIKDDVLIHITEEYQVDFTDRLMYVDESDEGDVLFNSEGWYYVVVDYQYSRRLPRPTAYLRVIKNKTIYSTYPDNYLFLGAAYVEYVENAWQISLVQYSDPSVIPPLERSTYAFGVPSIVDGGILTSIGLIDDE